MSFTRRAHYKTQLYRSRSYWIRGDFLPYVRPRRGELAQISTASPLIPDYVLFSEDWGRTVTVGSPHKMGAKWAKISLSLKIKNSFIMTNLHLSLWRSTALQLRRRATRNSRSINFAYWYVFLRTLYTAATLRLYTIYTDRRPITISLVTIFQFYNREIRSLRGRNRLTPW